MGLTAVVAALLVVARGTVSLVDFSGSLPDVTEVALATTLFTVLSALICIPCVRLALGEERSVPHLVALVLVLLGGPPAIVIAMTMAFGGSPDQSEILIAIHCFTLGLVGTILAALNVARQLGLRLVDPRQI